MATTNFFVLRFQALWRVLTQRNIILISDIKLFEKDGKRMRGCRLLRSTNDTEEGDFLTMKMALLANFEVDQIEERHHKEVAQEKSSFSKMKEDDVLVCHISNTSLKFYIPKSLYEDISIYEGLFQNHIHDDIVQQFIGHNLRIEDGVLDELDDAWTDYPAATKKSFNKRFFEDISNWMVLRQRNPQFINTVFEFVGYLEPQYPTLPYDNVRSHVKMGAGGQIVLVEQS